MENDDGRSPSLPPLQSSAAPTLSSFDVILAFILMGFAIGTGWWFGKGGGREAADTTTRAPSLLATALSLLVSAFSGITMMAAPAESYAHGIYFACSLFSMFWVVPIISHLFLPWLWRSEVVSVYDLIEQRFASARLRFYCSLLFAVSQVLYLAVAVYAPSQALAVVTGISLGIWIALTSVVSMAITLMGGFRGVVWTDAVLAVAMTVSLFLIMMRGINEVPGGAPEVFARADAAGRVTLFDFRLGSRTSVFAATLGNTVNALASYICNQVSTEHFLSLPSLSQARKGIWMQIPFVFFTVSMLYIIGVVIFAVFDSKAVEPVIARPDEILSYFVVTQLTGWGTAGLFLMALMAATTSTVASGLSGLSTLMLHDLAPAFGVQHLAAYQAVGGLTVAMWITAYVCAFMPSILFAANVVLGLSGGPLLGVFVLCSIRHVTTKGAYVGLASGVGGALFFIATQLAMPESALGSISFMWIPLIAFSLTVILGLAASTFSAATF